MTMSWKFQSPAFTGKWVMVPLNSTLHLCGFLECAWLRYPHIIQGGAFRTPSPAMFLSDCCIGSVGQVTL